MNKKISSYQKLKNEKYNLIQDIIALIKHNKDEKEVILKWKNILMREEILLFGEGNYHQHKLKFEGLIKYITKSKLVSLNDSEKNLRNREKTKKRDKK